MDDCEDRLGVSRRVMAIASGRRLLTVFSAAAIACLVAAAADDDAVAPDDAAPGVPAVHLVSVPLPITGNVDLEVQGKIERILSNLPAASQRPVLILEFQPKEGQAGEGSQFERSLSLARFLASEKFSQVRTVAYLPGSVKGHAVLVVMACEEIIMDGQAELGAAGLDEQFIDSTMRQGYLEIAQRRLTIKPPLALGMLDKSLAVFRVETLDGVRFVLREEKEQLKDSIITEETVVLEGDMGSFTGNTLRLKYGLVSHLASDRAELAAALNIPPQAIEEDPSLGGQWRAAEVTLQGRISSKLVADIQRGIQDHLRGSDTNFICVRIDSPGGSPTESMLLASYLAGLDSTRVRSVAYVDQQARGDAALVALACDHLVVTRDAILGGPGDHHIRAEELEDLRASVKEMARAKNRDWSPILAMVDPKLAIYRCRQETSGHVRYFSKEELAEQADPDQWQVGEALDTRRGFNGAELLEYGVAQVEVENFDGLLRHYRIEEDLQKVERSWAVSQIEQLAAQPWLARTLLFVAFFALISEASAPGLGVPGFVSGLCFLLFFWAQFLNGTAGWLEVLLFLGGATCVALEILVIPGLGIFGIGGALMIISSVVLASQTFVIPQNSYQLEQLPGSLFTATAAMLGSLVALAVMRYYLPDAPIFRRIMLAPPDDDQMEDLRQREAIVDFNHLLHKRGVASTQLTPSGKARFGDDVVDVISDGELVAAGTEVYVAEVRGNRVLVRPIEANA